MWQLQQREIYNGGLGFGVWGLGFGIWDLGFGIQGLEFGGWVWDSPEILREWRKAKAFGLWRCVRVRMSVRVFFCGCASACQTV